MATDRSLKSVRDLLVASYAQDLIDDVEFLLLYNENMSREIYPYWNFERFDLDLWDDGRCNTDFRFRKDHVFRLFDALNIPDRITTSQGTVCEGIEGLCILLKRLAFPCRYTDMVPIFGRNSSELCLIFNAVLDNIYSFHGHRLTTWNQTVLQPNMLHNYAIAIHQKGAPLDNCFGFVDGTVRPICRPQRNQNVVYNGHKRVHSLKFQSLALPNGIIGNLSGPYEGRRHDSTMLRESGLLTELRNHAMYNGNPLCIYGDPAYPLSIHLQAPFRGMHRTPQQNQFNEAMSKVRTSVEWLFGLITNYFKFVDFKKQQKLGLSPIGKLYIVCALLQNAHTCLYGNQVSEYFDMDPPTLEQYFN